jgi:hypothetical protein
VNCDHCHREQRVTDCDLPTSEREYDWFSTIDKTRVTAGGNTVNMVVCRECHVALTGKAPMSLRELNEQRKRKRQGKRAAR